MNTGIFRIIFNRALGQFVVAGELAKAMITGTVRSVKNREKKNTKPSPLALRIKPLVFASLLAAGCIQAPLSLADIVADPSSPNHQTLQIINTANGTPQVNIKEKKGSSIILTV